MDVLTLYSLISWVGFTGNSFLSIKQFIFLTEKHCPWERRGQWYEADWRGTWGYVSSCSRVIHSLAQKQESAPRLWRGRKTSLGKAQSNLSERQSNSLLGLFAQAPVSGIKWFHSVLDNSDRFPSGRISSVYLPTCSSIQKLQRALKKKSEEWAARQYQVPYSVHCIAGRLRSNITETELLL